MRKILKSLPTAAPELAPVIQELPNRIVELADSFHLPLPKYPIPPELSTLAAWAESDHLLMKERATDFFLMMLSGGENVRKNAPLSTEWSQWHSETDSINKLCSLIETGEELSAIRALIGKPFLDSQTAMAVSDQLIFRWKRRLIQTHQLSDSALGKTKPKPPNILEVRRAMRLHGLQCADAWLDQLLLCTQIATQIEQRHYAF